MGNSQSKYAVWAMVGLLGIGATVVVVFWLLQDREDPDALDRLVQETIRREVRSTSPAPSFQPAVAKSTARIPSEAAGAEATATERITNLEVEITTAGGPFAGLGDLPEVKALNLLPLPSALKSRLSASNDVWIDLGPKAWNVGHDFPAGQTVRKPLDLAGPPLFVHDLFQIRVEKKGVLGFCNASDNFLAPDPATGVPAPVSDLRKSVGQQRHVVATARAVFGEKDKLLREADKAIDEVQKRVNELTKAVREIDDKIGSLSGLENEAKKLLARIDSITGLPFRPHGEIEKAIYRGQLGDLHGRINGLKREATKWAKDKAALGTDLVTATAAKAEKVKLRAAVEPAHTAAKATLATAEAALRALEDALRELESLVAKLPAIGLPTYGEWVPQRVVVHVNKRQLFQYEIGQRLKRGHYSRMKSISTELADADRLARGLRVAHPDAGKTEQEIRFGQLASALTTPFKIEGISGWEDYPKDCPHVPVRNAKVVGKLVRPLAPGTDAYLSLDLEVEGLQSGARLFAFSKSNGFHQPRFIRVEYRFGTDRRFESWKVGDRIEAKGALRWDTDEGGFYEIHPAGQGDIRRLAPIGPEPNNGEGSARKTTSAKGVPGKDKKDAVKK